MPKTKARHKQKDNKHRIEVDLPQGGFLWFEGDTEAEAEASLDEHEELLKVNNIELDREPDSIDTLANGYEITIPGKLKKDNGNGNGNQSLRAKDK